MSDTNQEKVIKDLLKRIDLLEDRLKSHEDKEEMKLKHQLAEHVSSLVGLKEALTWHQRVIKWVWIILLCLGLAATIYELYAQATEYLGNPTATNVELQRPPFYNYPYVVLCPGGWFDVEKAMEKGFTLDSIKYSMAYTDPFILDDNTSVDAGREDFLELYKAYNYSSLLEYYKDMTIDLIEAPSSDEFDNNKNSSYQCYGCVSMEKIFTDQSMCYAFTLQDVDTGRFSGLNSPQIMLKLRGLPENTLQYSPNLRSYLLPDKNISVPYFQPITLEPFTLTTVKVTARKFFTLSNNDSNSCLESAKIPVANYSAEKCILNCMHGASERALGCAVFDYCANIHNLFPSNYCNFYENIPGQNLTFYDVYEDNTTALEESIDAENCIPKCPYACDRTVFTSTMSSKFTVRLSTGGTLKKVKEQNMTMMTIVIEHESVEQGGIMTLTEISTFSFSTLVSNVGGTLGLFMGGTIFTFFQLFLFCVSYAIDVRKRKNVRRKVGHDLTNGQSGSDAV